MARKGSERLQTLLKLAAMREQTAARQLSQSNDRLLQARQQSQQLQQYERDYQQRYIDNSGVPVSRDFLLNYQGFFHQLENAQLQQHRAIELRESDREQARLRWLEQYMKRRLLTSLRERRLASEELVAEKRAQREFDDRASRKGSRFRTDGN
ncbi:MAG TPA: flagellar export protein FliJ [Spongiibacteraceae bacterium]|nr:flagellar export protein FliJ [Spongiibacteraceae bacterium]